MTVKSLICTILLHAACSIAAPSPVLDPSGAVGSAFYHDRLVSAIEALQLTDANVAGTTAQVSSTKTPQIATATITEDSAVYYDRLLQAIEAFHASQGVTRSSKPLTTAVATQDSLSSSTKIDTTSRVDATTTSTVTVVPTAVELSATPDAIASENFEAFMRELVVLSGTCSLCPNGAWWSGTCYKTLEAAVKKANDNGMITVRGKLNIKDEIEVARDTTIVGQDCGGKRAAVTSMVNHNQKAIFLMTGKAEPVLSLGNIDFKNGKGNSRLIRSAEDNVKQEEADDKTNTGKPAYSLSLNGITATKFKTKARGGSVIFLQVAKHVDINNCDFTKNTVADPGKEYYGGGGAVNFHELLKGHTVSIVGSRFIDNNMEFEHGLGAAFTIAICDGTVDVIATQFIGNQAADGGAMHISRVGRDSVVTIKDSEFTKNIALEQGWGSRGSALRFKYISGTVLIDALFDSNVATEGRGVIANNRIQSTGRVEIAGVFINNSAKLGGLVWDTHNGHSGEVTIKAGTKISNVGAFGRHSLYLKGLYGTKTQRYSEAEINDPTSDLIVGKGDLIEPIEVYDPED